MITEFNNVTLSKFLELLNEFDKYYGYSDDLSVFKAGEAQSNKIKDYCNNPEFGKVYDIWLTDESVTKTPESRAKFLAVFLQPSKLVTFNREFVPAFDYLTDSLKALNYVCKRAKDAARLYTSLSWGLAGGDGIIVCSPAPDLVVYKSICSTRISENKIVEKGVAKSFKDENCMLAYILARFW